MIFSNCVSASTLTPLWSSPRRLARMATCEPDSSPVTYKVLPERLCMASIACKSRVDLPIPGSPPIKTTPASTIPPPKTRSNSSIPVAVLSTSCASMSLSAVTALAGAKLRALLYLFLLWLALSSIPSSSVFHSSQWGHLPNHLALVPPHVVHV